MEKKTIFLLLREQEKAIANILTFHERFYFKHESTREYTVAHHTSTSVTAYLDLTALKSSWSRWGVERWGVERWGVQRCFCERILGQF